MFQLVAALASESINEREELAFALTLCDPILGARAEQHLAKVNDNDNDSHTYDFCIMTQFILTLFERFVFSPSF